MASEGNLDIVRIWPRALDTRRPMNNSVCFGEDRGCRNAYRRRRAIVIEVYVWNCSSFGFFPGNKLKKLRAIDDMF